MPESEPVFVDTNLVLYHVDPSVPQKRTAARDWMDALWSSGRGRVSWQVIHEFYVNAVKKFGRPPEVAREAVEMLLLWEPVDNSGALIRRAWYWMDSAQLSYWDALIVAAAEHSGCRYLLTEDLQEGQNFEGVIVVNPFRSRPESVGLRARPN